MTAEETHVAAVVAKIGATAYGLAALAELATPPPYYVEVHVLEKLPDNFRADGTTGTRFYRVLTRAVARDYVNAQRQRDLTTAALDGAYLTVGSIESTQISREVSDDPIGPDDGWFSGLSEWRYAV